MAVIASAHEWEVFRMNTRGFLRMVLGFVAALATSSQAFAGIFPSTVAEVDLNRYVGKWYEVQSTKPFFQKGCVCNTAEYALRDDGKISVVNSCNDTTPQGHERIFEASAVPTSDPAKLIVSAVGISLPIPNYWIVDLAPDYSYAVVSSFLRTPVWILSRTPDLSQETLDGIYARLQKDGFDTKALSDTPQSGCSN